MMNFNKLKRSLCMVATLLSLGGVLWAEESKELIFDQVKIKALTQKTINTPIRPGVPGKIPFWNARANSFIYAPVFEFSEVPGAKSYRFSVTTFGPKAWTVELPSSKNSLKSIWKELADGKLTVKLVYFKNSQGRWKAPRQKPKMMEKKPGSSAGTLAFTDEPGAKMYRFIIEGVKELSFEAEKPWASLVPIWNDIPFGRAVLKVEGLDKKGGQVMGSSKVTVARSKKTHQAKVRVFERRAPFAGPYHDAAIDYAEAGATWLRHFAKEDNRFRKWLKGEGDPKRLGKYPCKEEVSVIKGSCMLAKVETDSAKKEEYLTMARNAARTLIKGSFPKGWGLEGMPPTYGGHKEGSKTSYSVVLMAYPAEGGDAYLDLYSLTKEKEFLDAAIRVADRYKKLQLPNGGWDMMMNAKTGKKMAWSKSLVVPINPMKLFKRLSEEFGFKEYAPFVISTWKWILKDMIPQFRFEGQFEDTCSRGGDPWHISHHTARRISNFMFKNAKDDVSYLPLAQEILRWQEDQFVYWELPGSYKKEKYTPFTVEQHNGPLEFSTPGYTSDIGGQLHAWLTAYKATGKELYLAKAITMGNAMVTLQKVKYRGLYINTFWGDGGGLDQWVNCHMANAEYLIELGETLKEKNLFVKINPDSGKDLPFFNKKKR